MSLSHQIIAKNNHAVALIEAGNYEDAISNLSHTLTTFRQMVINHDTTSNESVLKTSLDACMESTPVSAVVRDVSSAVDIFLYENGIAIPGNFISSGFHETTMVSCIIVFNLALAQHLYYRSSKPTNVARHSSLHKALRLYDLAFKLQREARMQDSVMFSLAVVNNVALVHRQLRDEQAATKCFEFVLSLLMYMTDCGHSNVFVLEGFFLNVSNLICQPRVAPAA
jgi:hypothetical protein